MLSLKAVDFISAEGQPIDGLVSVRRPAEAKSPHEHAIVRQAQAFEAIDYVYFRRFEDAEGRHVRSSQLLAYVVDNSRQRRSKDDLAKLHHKLWLQGLAPLIYVAWSASVDVLSCARQPDFWDDRKAEVRYAAAETIKVSMDIGNEAELSKSSPLASSSLASLAIEPVAGSFDAVCLLS